ncbi:hypothetical protein LCGC14_1071090 [marine sediment metagenome]|uniref:Uncharacterized protein n=1 Tax=marine sediment metagenome TaxID=412755 RepID=A0A0F9MN36_9ZZZZ
MNHKLLNKTLKEVNRELRQKVKELKEAFEQTQIELECVKLITKKQSQEAEK